MASHAKAANNQTTSDTGAGEVIYDPALDEPCAALRLKCRSDSASAVLFSEESMHGGTDFDELEPGESVIIRNGSAELGKVRVKVAAGSATISWSKIAKLVH